jgi:hypothetical protein
VIATESGRLKEIEPDEPRRSIAMRQGYSQRRTDSLDYMQSMLGQLRTMAEAERCDMLAYLIEMAYVEVSDILRGDRPLRVQGGERDGPSGMPLEPARKVKLQ